MTPRREQRTEPGGRAEAVIRLAQARKFREVADLVRGAEADIPSSASVAASLAVLAGIAASDAACFAALGRRSRSQNHRDASTLLSQIEPDGKKAAQAFARLIDLEDTAHYGIITVGPEKLRVAIRDADTLVTFAEQTLSR